MNRTVQLASTAAALLSTGACSEPLDASSGATSPGEALLRHVDPFIGTANEGHTFPGAVVPWGMVSPSPHTARSKPGSFFNDDEPFAPSGYLFGGKEIFGFGATHLSGTGCPDLGVPLVMATRGEPAFRPAENASGYTDEIASPGYYAVRLSRSGVRVETTASTRVAVFRFDFPEDAEGGNVVLDAKTTLGWVSDAGHLFRVSPSELEGYSETGGFCAAQNRRKVFFVVRAERPTTEIRMWNEAREPLGADAEAGAGAVLRFDTSAAGTVTLKVGISYVSVSNARENLEAEVGAATFDAVHARAKARWAEALSRVHVTGGEASDKTRFYTALYHALIHPSVLSDVNGEYPVMASSAEQPETATVAAGTVRYHVFSLWDTYRNLHPLLTLLFPAQQLDMVRSLVDMTREAGRPPRWELAGQETDIMVGDPAAIVIADSYVKGLTDFDAEGAYQLLRDAAFDVTEGSSRPGNAAYRQHGYIPLHQDDTVWGPVSTTLEYALADSALAQFASALGRASEAETFRRQSVGYRALFDPELGVLRPRLPDGSFLSPFDPNAANTPGDVRDGGPGFVEGTAYQYAFCAPHDVSGLMLLHGGKDALAGALQWVFDEGKFELWNEPDMGYPYLFTQVPGEEWRTQAAVADARRRYFKTGPSGLPGNDDAGTMSAWFVFSALGLYPDPPGSARYALGTPLFKRAVLKLDPAYYSGDAFVIEATGASAESPYVASVTFRGQAVRGAEIQHADVAGGGTLRYQMSGVAPGRENAQRP